MSRLIDADRLLERTKFYNLKNGNKAIDEIDILHAPTVKAIPIEVVEQIRAEIEKRDKSCYAYEFCADEILKIIDKAIKEVSE